MTNNNIKICYFPGRESTYVRNRVLIKGMREAGLTVYDCSHPKKNFSRYIIGFLKFLRYKGKSDLIFIGFFGQFLVPLIKIFTRKKIIFEAFLSAYQTLAFDRKSIKPEGFKATIIRYFEKKSCLQADKVLLDTHQHIEYFIKEYHIDKTKFHRSFLSADDSFSGLGNGHSSNEFIIHFHGEFQALHGTQYILQAAKLLPDLKFRMIGGGRELNDCLNLAKELNIQNVNFISPVPFNEISRYIAEASICLGIFGETQKTQIVIPFKIYESLVLSKAIITADTPAVRELLTHEEDIYLCKAANPKSLAEAIETLRTDDLLRKKIAQNAYETYRKKCSPLIVGEEIRALANQLVNRH